MISVIICVKHPGEWEIDTWLMSCRVLKRGVEEAVCNRVARDARAARARRLIGTFIPTDRNGLVRGLFEQLGFVRLVDGEGGVDGERWALELDHFSPLEVFLTEQDDPTASIGAG